ncbi:MAG: alpha/beta hydrolase [Clostridiales Family XIII bacterium]|jgi:pimeloyl-ACP methyl ester carboxylesterase|nr:alpha/beta hydrolase [Clostridiales Family XIII bacterium]
MGKKKKRGIIDGSFKSANGTVLRYTDRGAGKVVVFLHGIFQDRHALSAMADRLSYKASCRCVTMELRGHGRARGVTDFSLDSQAGDIDSLITHLHQEEVTLAGYSFGAYSILNYLKHFGDSRVKAIALMDISPKILSDDDWKLGIMDGGYGEGEWKNDLVRIKDDFRGFVANFIYRAAAVPPAGGYKDEPPIWAYLSIPMVTSLDDKAKASAYALWEAMAQADYIGLLDTIAVPALIVCAVPGSLFPPEASEYMSEKIGSNARLVRVGGSGKKAVSHRDLIEHRREIVSELVKLL